MQRNNLSNLNNFDIDKYQYYFISADPLVISYGLLEAHEMILERMITFGDKKDKASVKMAANQIKKILGGKK